jgi:hypothetical protein
MLMRGQIKEVYLYIIEMPKILIYLYKCQPRIKRIVGAGESFNGKQFHAFCSAQRRRRRRSLLGSYCNFHVLTVSRFVEHFYSITFNYQCLSNLPFQTIYLTKQYMLQVTVFSLPATHTGRWPYPTLKQEGHSVCLLSRNLRKNAKKKYPDCANIQIVSIASQKVHSWQLIRMHSSGFKRLLLHPWHVLMIYPKNIIFLAK